MALAHDIPLIATVSVGLGMAFIAGFAATRMGLPALVGYLVAGIIIGPFTPGIVANASIAAELAEIGVILLMFGVGMHFSVRDLWAVRRIAVPGAVAQILLATLLGAGVARYWGWPLGGAIIFGLALSVASTVVMLRALQERGRLDAQDGRIAVGWLVVEDLVMVLTLVLLPALAGPAEDVPGHAPGVSDSLAFNIAITLGKIGLFFVLIYGVGVRLFPWLFGQIARTGSRELVTLFMAAVGISLAYAAAEVFAVSFALGAFLAGVVINEAGLSQRIASHAEALEHVFAVLFFVSVGMLFNPSILITEPLRVLIVLGIIMIGKSLAALAIVLLFRRGLATALTVSASLAQIGEFSFILAGLGISLQILPPEGRDLILAGALLSITLNPLAFRLAAALGRRGQPPTAPAPVAETCPVLDGHVILIGYGRVGRPIAKRLSREGVPFVVIEQNLDVVERLRQKQWPVVAGDACVPGVLANASLRSARLLLVATPNSHEARRMIDSALAINPQIEIIVRADGDAEREYFKARGIPTALTAERQLADAILVHVLNRYGAHSSAAP